MTDREQEMMERYIYQVTRRLPGDQRKETALELQELIDKVSTDQAVIDEAINSALSELDATIGDFEDFGTLDMSELSEAEDFSAGEGEGEDFETFEEE